MSNRQQHLNDYKVYVDSVIECMKTVGMLTELAEEIGQSMTAEAAIQHAIGLAQVQATLALATATLAGPVKDANYRGSVSPLRSTDGKF